MIPRILLSLLLVLSSFASAQQLQDPSVRDGQTLKLLTFNVWMLEVGGIKLAQDIDIRRELIADQLLKSDYDVVALQEVWALRHVKYFARTLKERFPYCVYHFAVTPIPPGPRAPLPAPKESSWGNGLMIFSRIPLQTGRKSTYGCSEPKNLLIYKEATRLDENLVSKGAMHVVLQPSPAQAIDFYTTHLGAITYKAKTGLYEQKQIARADRQAQDMVAFIDRTRTTQSFLFAGDLNQNPNVRDASGPATQLTELYKRLGAVLGWSNVFTIANGLSLDQTADISTYDTKNNPNASGGHFSQNPAELIDYIFTGGGDTQVKPISSRIVYDSRIGDRMGKSYFLSDHYGLEATFELR